MNKIVAGIGIIVVILIAVGAFWLFSVPPATAAILYVDEGTVEVDAGAGWLTGQDGMELPAGAKIRTGAGAASVIMLEGEVMHLEPNTEVALKEITSQKIKIAQALGETWHKVTRISGISTYEVETPNTVATVRGTEFFVKVDEEDEIAVEEGEVEVGFVKTPSKKLAVGPKRKMTMQPKLDMMTEKVIDEDARPAKFRQQYIKHLKRVRMLEVKKNAKLIGIAQRQYGITDEQVKRYLEEMDEGKQDEDKAYEQLPAPLKKRAERAYKITKAIKEAKRAEETAKDTKEMVKATKEGLVPKAPEEKRQLREELLPKEALNQDEQAEARQLPENLVEPKEILNEQAEARKPLEDPVERIDKVTASINDLREQQ